MFNSSNTSDMYILEHDIGGVAYILMHGATYIPYLTLYCLGLLCGTLGNILIMAAIVTTKELHSSNNWLIFNLALADIWISCFVDGMTVATAFLGMKWFDDKKIVCVLLGMTCLVACATSMANIWLLALNRYINICYHSYYSKIFSEKKTFVYCILTWLIGFLVDLPNLLGWGGHTYSKTTLACLWDRHVSHGYNIFFPMTTIVIPCISILFFYTRIFIFVSRSSKRTLNQENNNVFQSKKNQKSIQIAKGLFGSFLLFTLCWLPYGIVVMTDVNYIYPAALEAYTLLVAHLNSAFNPIFYAAYNPTFRLGYKKVIYKLAGKTYVLKSDQRTFDRTLNLNQNPSAKISNHVLSDFTS